MTESRNSKIDTLRERTARQLAWSLILTAQLTNRPVDEAEALEAARRTLAGGPARVRKALAALDNVIAALEEITAPTVH